MTYEEIADQIRCITKEFLIDWWDKVESEIGCQIDYVYLSPEGSIAQVGLSFRCGVILSSDCSHIFNEARHDFNKRLLAVERASSIDEMEHVIDANRSSFKFYRPTFHEIAEMVVTKTDVR